MRCPALAVNAYSTDASAVQIRLWDVCRLAVDNDEAFKVAAHAGRGIWQKNDRLIESA